MKVLNNNDKINRSIIENMLVISIMALYIVYGIHYTPLLMIFIPLPFVVIGIRNGMSNNIISMAITSLIVGVVSGAPSAVTLLLIFAPLSIALNYSMKKRKKTIEIILFSTAAFFLPLLIIISLGNKAGDLDLAIQFEQAFTQFITMQTDIFKEMGKTNYEVLQNIELLESYYKSILIALPSILAIISLFVGYFNYLFITIILRKTGYGVVSPSKFSKFKLPNNIILGTGVMFFATIIMERFKIPYHNALLVNISFLVGFIFLLQGLSVLDFLLIKLKMRLIFRTIILLINIAIIPMGGILFFIGILDSIFDIRKIRKRKSL